MGRILRAAPGWEDQVTQALRRAPRPIPGDERLWPRDASGSSSRARYRRADFPPARPASTMLLLYPDDDGELRLPLTVRLDTLRAHAGEGSLPGGAVDARDA